MVHTLLEDSESPVGQNSPQKLRPLFSSSAAVRNSGGGSHKRPCEKQPTSRAVGAVGLRDGVSQTSQMMLGSCAPSVHLPRGLKHNQERWKNEESDHIAVFHPRGTG